MTLLYNISLNNIQYIAESIAEPEVSGYRSFSTVNKTALYTVGEDYEVKLSCNHIVIDCALIVNGVYQ